MRALVLTCVMLLASCGRDAALAALDLEPCAGWVGGRVVTEQDFARAAGAEKFGRLCANEKLNAVKKVRGDVLTSRESGAR